MNSLDYFWKCLESNMNERQRKVISLSPFANASKKAGMRLHWTTAKVITAVVHSGVFRTLMDSTMHAVWRFSKSIISGGVLFEFHQTANCLLEEEKQWQVIYKIPRQSAIYTGTSHGPQCKLFHTHYTILHPF